MRIQMLFLVVISSPAFLKAGETMSKSLSHGGLNRAYTVFVPDSYDAIEPVPLLVNYHGWGSNNSQQATITRMNNVAEAEGFIVVYPRSVGSHWNVMQHTSGPDDIAFTDALLDQLEEDYTVDVSRVYATGFSNGGSMSFLAGSRLPNRFAAIAPVAATLPAADDLGAPNPIDPTSSPTSSRAIPVMYMLGTDDPLVAYDGGTSPNSGYLYPATGGVMSAWATNNLCQSEPDSVTLPDIVLTDRSTVTVLTYQNCETYTAWDGSEQIEASVVHYRINGGGHVWPSSLSWPERFGTVNRDIQASEEVWAFLSRHTLPFRESLDVCDFD